MNFCASHQRPLRGGARATIAVAAMGPMPGTVISLRDTSSSREPRDFLVEISAGA
jgi:hypothetical protein